MFQNQYLNQALNKNQIERIIQNYSIKYNTLKKEINVKIDNLINVMLIDLSQFYEGIQKNSKDKEIQKNYEKAKNEIQLLNLQLKQKSHIESKLKNEIEELKLKNQQKESGGVYLKTEPKSKNILPSKKKRNNESLPKYIINSPRTVRTGKNTSCKKIQTVHLHNENEIKSTKPSTNASLYQTEKSQKFNQREKNINNEQNILTSKTFKHIDQKLKYKTARKDKNTRKSLDFQNTSNFVNFIEEEQEENGGKCVSSKNIFDFKNNNSTTGKDIKFLFNDYRNVIKEEDELLKDEERILKKLLEIYE
jgi:hypothetical protein